jgi:hypothetical protein
MNHPNNNQPPAKARRDDLVVQEMPDEVLVYDLKSHKAHCLNETAAFVWNHCDGKTTATEMAAFMEKEWGKPVTEDVVWLALKQLSRAELLQERIAPSVEGMRASRRAVLRKLGAAAAMTPLVISIVAPTASAGASIPPTCTACNLFGSGSGRMIHCPPECGPFIGTCYNNASCNGIGGQFPPATCVNCFTNNPTSSSWRVVP